MIAAEDFERLIRQPVPALLAVASGLVLGLSIGWITGGRDTTSEVVTQVTVTENAPPPTVSSTSGGSSQEDDLPANPSGGTRAEMARWTSTLRGAVRSAERLGGDAEAAVWLDGWPEPVTGGNASRRMRLWSLSKPPTAVAVLKRAGDPSAALDDAIRAAITRSENCRQRRVVLGLERLTGGAEGARAALGDVFRQAGADGVAISDSTAPADVSCRTYLQAAGRGLPDPLGPALQLGTSEWTVRDGVAFMHALGNGVYGEAGAKVQELMALPKERSRELTSDNDFSAPSDWGAGRAFAGFPGLAYKAGWGGVAQGRFLAAQAGIVPIGDRRAAVMAVFHPSTQPPSDDPGKTQGPKALEDMFRRMALQLRRSGATP